MHQLIICTFWVWKSFSFIGSLGFYFPYSKFPCSQEYLLQRTPSYLGSVVQDHPQMPATFLLESLDHKHVHWLSVQKWAADVRSPKLDTTYLLLTKNPLRVPNPLCNQQKRKGVLEDFWGKTHLRTFTWLLVSEDRHGWSLPTLNVLLDGDVGCMLMSQWFWQEARPRSLTNCSLAIHIRTEMYISKQQPWSPTYCTFQIL